MIILINGYHMIVSMDLGFLMYACSLAFTISFVTSFLTPTKRMRILSLMCISDCFNLFRQGDGDLYCGLHVDNGRIKGTMKKTLREIIEKYNLNVSITPNQNIVLCDIRRAWRRPITTALAQSGLLVRHLEFTLGEYTFDQCFHQLGFYMFQLLC